MFKKKPGQKKPHYLKYKITSTIRASVAIPVVADNAQATNDVFISVFSCRHGSSGDTETGTGVGYGVDG